MISCGNHITEFIKKKGPRSYIISDMITGKLYKTHVQHMKLAKMQWNTPPPLPASKYGELD